MPKPNPVLLEILESLLQEAKRGTVTELFAVVLWADGEYEDYSASNDIQLLLTEVQQLALRARIRAGEDQDGPTGHH